MRRTAIAVAVVLFSNQAHAGIMTQTTNFNFASHAGTGAIPSSYNQLDPSLGPLNAVIGTLSMSAGQFETFQVTNPTSNTISFNVTQFGSFGETNAGQFTITSTEPVTLLGGQSTTLPPLMIPPGFQTSLAQTTDLSKYVGTGQLFFLFGFNDGALPDNSLIRVSNSDGYRIPGAETVTYLYGSTLLLPAPPSLVMLSLGLIVAGGLAWRHRKAKLAP
jgi:hypothetical protein